jgi:GNAT superfamily N-acetyltransferase
MPPEIERIETQDLAARKAIFDALDAYNDLRTGRPEPLQWLGLLLREPGSQRIAGGLWAVSYYDWMFIELLVVPEALRGQGLGTRLMRQAEAVARERGCIGVWLDTFSFQARSFYERLGYRVIATIGNYPNGHSRLFLTRRLDRAD